ncbi:alpha/beta hydrolase [Actinomadura kijaniata]|uniref:Pimeloyl-ACP methyl ester carboxylesterase n=1 Tax=Actinomadura namibiensis TaxID=182080 RepID=A0A7W3LU10_ACTNM|nr:alpha/beta hydrolase [Actinomadura namibiensis]MBA8954249.1 pimeloyl-ACP methyl ester carboxylesterase [Actinomadura namibiensis]
MRTFPIAAAALTLSALAPVPAAHAAAPARCQDVTVAVSMAPGEPADQRVAGTLCTPPGRRATTVQVLVPGGTYGQGYWSTRPAPGVPSYVESMNRAGYATLAIDRLGAGRSSRPSSDRYRPQTHTGTVRQVLRELRAGRIGGRPFARVVLAGHSLGSAIAMRIAVDQPRAVDGLVLTGVASRQNDAAFAELEQALHPANRDPRFAGRGLDDGYVTTRPGTRADFFYHRPTMAPATLARDEAAAQPDVFPSFEAFPTPEEYRRIQVPVLLAVGRHDRLICGGAGSDCSGPAALRAQEAPWYGPSARLRAVVVPGSGHSINLQRTAPVLFEAVRSWADRYVAPR